MGLLDSYDQHVADKRVVERLRQRLANHAGLPMVEVPVGDLEAALRAYDYERQSRQYAQATADSYARSGAFDDD